MAQSLLSIHFCASFALAAASDLAGDPEAPDPEEDPESPSRVALAATTPPMATTAASAAALLACESVFFDLDFFFALVALELFALEGVAAFVAGADLEDVLPRALSFAAPVSVPLKRFFCGRSGSTLA